MAGVASEGQLRSCERIHGAISPNCTRSSMKCTCTMFHHPENSKDVFFTYKIQRERYHWASGSQQQHHPILCINIYDHIYIYIIDWLIWYVCIYIYINYKYYNILLLSYMLLYNTICTVYIDIVSAMSPFPIDKGLGLSNQRRLQ